jgi:hypothetical protein
MYIKWTLYIGQRNQPSGIGLIPEKHRGEMQRIGQSRVRVRVYMGEGE